MKPQRRNSHRLFVDPRRSELTVLPFYHPWQVIFPLQCFRHELFLCHLLTHSSAAQFFAFSLHSPGSIPNSASYDWPCFSSRPTNHKGSNANWDFLNCRLQWRLWLGWLFSAFWSEMRCRKEPFLALFCNVIRNEMQKRAIFGSFLQYDQKNGSFLQCDQKWSELDAEKSHSPNSSAYNPLKCL